MSYGRPPRRPLNCHTKACPGSAGLALAAVIFVFWGRPIAVVTIVIAALLLVALGLIELIGRPPPQPAPTPPATSE